MDFRQQLEERWRERLKAAQAKYYQARGAAAEAMLEWHQGDLPRADGFLAVHQANSAELDSVQEYMRVLRIFRDLVIDGKTPEEPS
jgi:hypothetical protein